MFFSSVFDNAFMPSSSDAVQFCDRSDSLSAFQSLYRAMLTDFDSNSVLLIIE